MYLKFICVLLLFVLNCSINGGIYGQQCLPKYKIIKIDSTKNSFLVYAKKRKERFLIVSYKTISKAGNRIKLGNRYKFDLSDYMEHERLVDPLGDVSQSYSIDGKEIWKSEDDFYVWKTKNLDGLFYIKNPKR